jgi:hypothetical protein
VRAKLPSDSARKTISDPELGECTVFGGSRYGFVVFSLMGCAGFVPSAWSAEQAASGAAGSSAMSTSQLAAGLALSAVSFLVAAWFWRTHLAVGERGFRLVEPFKRVQLLWSQVGSCDLIDENTKREKLVVGLWCGQGGNAGSVKIGSISASNHAIWELMTARWKAAWAAVPDWSGAKPDTEKDAAHELQSVQPLDWQEK